jgi:hypothetical protein
MPPLSFFLKHTVRALTLLVAAGTLIAAAGCGGSGNNFGGGGGGGGGNGNFTNASLNGQYLISQTGIGVNQTLSSADPFSETIVFKADGNKNLTVTVDDFNQDGVPFGLPANTTLTGTYSIGSDGTGFLSFNGANYAITFIDVSHFYVIEWDTFATASGFGEKQDTTKFTAAPSGNFVFKAHNINTSSRVGGVAITGGVIAGNEDLLSFGLVSSSQPVASSVSMTTPGSNGRGTFTLADGSAFNYYIANENKFYLMSNLGSLEIGQAEMQAGPFSLATLAAGKSWVFGSSGDTSFPLGIHSAGVFTTDGNGNIEAGTSTVPGALDVVQDATVNSNLTISGGTYTLDSTGHGEIDLTSSLGTTKQKFWMLDGTRAYFLVNSSAAVEGGTFSQQQGAPFTALSSQAAFVMDGFDTTYKDRVGEFKPSSSTFTWNQAANAFDKTQGLGVPSTLPTSGSYQVSSNGRVTSTVNGVTGGVVFYLSAPNTGFMVQEDADIGGAFTQQTQP